MMRYTHIFIVMVAFIPKLCYSMQPQQLQQPSAAQQIIAQQLAAMQLLSPQQTQVYKQVLQVLVNATQSVAVQKAGEQVKNSIKNLLTLYLKEVSSKLTNEQKAIVHPILVQVNNGLTLALQYPNVQLAPATVHTQLQQIQADISLKLMPFGLVADQLKETKVDEEVIRKTVQTIQEAITSALSSFKPGSVRPQVKPAAKIQ